MDIKLTYHFIEYRICIFKDEDCKNLALFKTSISLN